MLITNDFTIFKTDDPPGTACYLRVVRNDDHGHSFVTDSTHKPAVVYEKRFSESIKLIKSNYDCYCQTTGENYSAA